MDTSNKAFVEQWQRVGPILEEIRREEQRQLTPEEHLQAVANVLPLAMPEQGNGRTSGLVEQQRIFLLGRP